jgi:hypothetical protein
MDSTTSKSDYHCVCYWECLSYCLSKCQEKNTMLLTSPHAPHHITELTHLTEGSLYLGTAPPGPWRPRSPFVSLSSAQRWHGIYPCVWLTSLRAVLSRLLGCHRWQNSCLFQDWVTLCYFSTFLVCAPINKQVISLSWPLWMELNGHGAQMRPLHPDFSSSGFTSSSHSSNF